MPDFEIDNEIMFKLGGLTPDYCKKQCRFVRCTRCKNDNEADDDEADDDKRCEFCGTGEALDDKDYRINVAKFLKHLNLGQDSSKLYVLLSKWDISILRELRWEPIDYLGRPLAFGRILDATDDEFYGRIVPDYLDSLRDKLKSKS